MKVDAQFGIEHASLTAAEMQEQVHHLAISAGFKNSDPIRHVLLYLAKQAIDCPGHSVKEHQIATDALGRTADFDPRVDSTVRVVVTRLRAKLAEYYTHEGIRDPILVDIPKGAYMLSFKLRQANGLLEAQPAPVVSPFTPTPTSVSSQRTVPAALWIGAVLVLFATAAASFFAGRSSALPKPPAEIVTFWDGFLKRGDPLIVFSNPIFEGAPESGMHLLDPWAFHTAGTNDTFTGTGEVMAVHAITEELAALGRQTRVKRARLFTWDEALANNLIIIGGPAQSSIFNQLPQLEHIVLKPTDQEPYLGENAVRNTKTDATHQITYYRPERTRDGGIEYAIVALTPGASSDHSNLVVAGTNTFATQAAAKFVCSPTSLKVLLGELKTSGQPLLPRFEALLRVEIRGGAPMEPQLVLLYRRSFDVSNLKRLTS